MATVINPGSVGKVETIPDYRERIAKTWDRLGKHSKPDHLHLQARAIAQAFRDGQYDPLPR